MKNLILILILLIFLIFCSDGKIKEESLEIKEKTSIKSEIVEFKDMFSKENIDKDLQNIQLQEIPKKKILNFYAWWDVMLSRYVWYLAWKNWRNTLTEKYNPIKKQNTLNFLF